MSLMQLNPQAITLGAMVSGGGLMEKIFRIRSFLIALKKNCRQYGENIVWPKLL